MAAFDPLTRRRLLGMAGITLASPLLLSLPRLGFAADEHAAHHTPQEPAGTGEFIRLDAPRKLKLAVNLNAVYGRHYERFSDDELRDLVSGPDLFRNFDNRDRPD